MRRFRLYPCPGASTLYVTVLVWPTLAAMRAYIRRMHVRRGTSHIYGYCASFTKRRHTPSGWRTSGEFAEISVAARYCSQEIVTHEVEHAALAWARRVKLPLAECASEDASPHVSPTEERLCGVVGRLNNQLAGKLQRTPRHHCASVTPASRRRRRAARSRT